VEGRLVGRRDLLFAVAKKASLGESIRTARERAKMTQSQLARALGVAQGTIARIESGGREAPRFTTVVKIATVLGISLDALAVDAGILPRSTAVSESAGRAATARALRGLQAARERLADSDDQLAAIETELRTSRRS